MERTLRFLALALLGAGATACATSASPAVPEPVPAFGTGVLRIASGADTFRVRVEIAETERQLRRGLSGRTALAEDAGMLFLFPDPQPPGSGFWMHRTTLPLSLAFLDAEGVVLRIVEMEPCRSPLSLFCRRYRAGVPYHSALEVGRGWFARRGIGPGARVVLHREAASTRR